MKNVLVAVCMTLLLLACGNSKEVGVPKTSEGIDEPQAKVVAVHAFQEATRNEVLEYSVSSSKSSNSAWEYEIRGTGNYARPGFYWRVRVDKATGQATVRGGE